MEPKEPQPQNPENLSGQQLLERENTVREQGNTLEAIDLAQKSFHAFLGEGNLIGASQSCTAESISWGHLGEMENNTSYRLRAKHTALLGGDIAKSSGKPEALALPLFGIGRTLLSLGESKEAATFFKDAIAVLPQSEHNRPSVLADMTVQMEVANYKNGDKIARERALKGLSDLEASTENKYEKDVWVSGGYMKIAEAIYVDDPAAAHEYLLKAKEIIDANPDLKLRQEQLAKLTQKLA